MHVRGWVRHRPRTVSNLAKFSGSKETPRTHSTLSRAHPTITHPPSPHFSLLLGFSRRPTSSLPPPHETSRASQRARVYTYPLPRFYPHPPLSLATWAPQHNHVLKTTRTRERPLVALRSLRQLTIPRRVLPSLSRSAGSRRNDV